MQVFLRKFCSVITSFNYNVAIVVTLFTNFTLSAVACAFFNMRFMIYFFILCLFYCIIISIYKRHRSEVRSSSDLLYAAYK